MKFSVIAAPVGILALSAVASATPFLGMTVETVQDTGVANSVTYRVYAMIQSNARIDAVFGNSVQEYNVATGAGMSFHQDPFGGNLSADINASLLDFFPTLAADSYLTIGATDSVGAEFDAGNGLGDVGIEPEAYDQWNAGGSLVFDNGSYFVTNDMDQGEGIATADASINKVLIGQFTVLGATGDVDLDLVGVVNLQGADASGETWQAFGATWNFYDDGGGDDGGDDGGNGGIDPEIPAPGVLALLGIAGLAGSRRRRA